MASGKHFLNTKRAKLLMDPNLFRAVHFSARDVHNRWCIFWGPASLKPIRSKEKIGWRQWTGFLHAVGLLFRQQWLTALLSALSSPEAFTLKPFTLGFVSSYLLQNGLLWEMEKALLSSRRLSKESNICHSEKMVLKKKKKDIKIQMDK